MKKNLIHGRGMPSVWTKSLRLMKLICFFFFIGLLQVSASVYSQSKKLTLDINDRTVLEVLEEIEKQSEFRFAYSSELVDMNRRVTVDISEKTIDEALKIILEGTDVTYSLNDRHILLYPKELISKPEVPTFSSQQKTISGNVTNSSGQALPGVTIVVKGTTQGTVSDVDGNFSVTNVPNDATLVFSFIGMKTVEIQVEGKSSIDVVMTEDAIGLEEVVAVGYGTMRKADLTGAVSSVTSTDLEKNTVIDPLLALQGKAAGISITPVSGQPGASIQVNIRGVQSINASNNPIYVVDGIISDGIGHINTNDIESISVLKDASSTAIYGSRAANGVVLITTKRGKMGAPVITFHTYQGVRTRSNLMPDMLNSNDFLHLMEESYANSDQEVPNTSELANTYYKDANGNIIDTDWLDVIMRTGTMQYYDLSVSGGSEKSNYFISTNYLKEKGLIIGQGQEKLNFRFNSDHKIGKFLQFGNTLNLHGYKNFGLPDLGYVNYPNSPNPYLGALRKTPLTRPYEDDGSYGYTRYEGIEYRYIPPHLIAQEYKRSAQYNGFSGNIYLKIKPIEGLTFTPSISLTKGFTNNSSFTPTVHLLGTEAINVNHVAKSTSQSLHWQMDFMAEYEKTFLEKHKIKALAVYSQEESESEYLNGARDNTPLNSIHYLNAADPSTASNSNGFSDWSFVSYLGRLNYDYAGKYLLQATIRRDGSSRFSDDNRWAVFPSFSAGWRISEEGFWGSLKDVINDMKIRASIGTVGNSAVGNYPTYASLGTTTYVLNETVVPAYTFRSAVNADLKWETTKKKDVGVDLSLLESKVTFSANYFVANTTDLLFSKPLPPSSGKSGGLMVNGGEVENRGIELDLGLRGRKGDFNYDLAFNFSRQRNEVIDLLGQDLTTSGLKVGYPVYSYYGFRSNGIIKTEADLSEAPTRSNLALGDVWLLDVESEEGEAGVIDNEDKTIIGSKYPDFTYGLVSNFSYKDFSLSIQLQGVHGIDLPYDVGNYFMGNPENNRDLILERWHQTENPDGNMPRIQTSDPAGNFSFSDFWLSDASYLRINNVTLSYDLPQAVCNRVLLKDAQVYFTAQNLYTFTKSGYRGVEVDMTYSSSYYGNPTQKMPLPRTLSMGVKLSF